eukprot:281354-Chlamydomonas_euryale.AAC.1
MRRARAEKEAFDVYTTSAGQHRSRCNDSYAWRRPLPPPPPDTPTPSQLAGRHACGGAAAHAAGGKAAGGGAATHGPGWCSAACLWERSRTYSWLAGVPVEARQHIAQDGAAQANARRGGTSRAQAHDEKMKGVLGFGNPDWHPQIPIMLEHAPCWASQLTLSCQAHSGRLASCQLALGSALALGLALGARTLPVGLRGRGHVKAPPTASDAPARSRLAVPYAAACA